MLFARSNDLEKFSFSKNDSLHIVCTSTSVCCFAPGFCCASLQLLCHVVLGLWLWRHRGWQLVGQFVGQPSGQGPKGPARTVLWNANKTANCESGRYLISPWNCISDSCHMLSSFIHTVNLFISRSDLYTHLQSDAIKFLCRKSDSPQLSWDSLSVYSLSVFLYSILPFLILSLLWGGSALSTRNGESFGSRSA